MAVEPIQRSANVPDEVNYNRKQSPKCHCSNEFVVNESKLELGYNSDGQVGLLVGFTDAESEQLFEEAPATIYLPESNTLYQMWSMDKMQKKIKILATPSPYY